MKKTLLLNFLLIISTALAQKKILIIDASDAEKKELLRSSIQERYSFVFYDIENDANNYGNEDLSKALEEIKQRYHNNIDGVLSTQDYLGNILASLVADACNLPGPSPHAVLTCQHKYYSRIAQQKFVPRATPHFGLIDPDNVEQSIATLSFSFPFFVKPVKSYFSFGAMKITHKDELEKNLLYVLPATAFLKPLDDTLKKYTDYQLTTNYLLAEELLEGSQVTVEGFVQNGRTHIIGIVDSIMYPGTISFQRFEYPSSFPIRIQKRMATIAKKFVKGIKFDNSFFNIEMMYNAKTNKIHIIEVNPRCAAQFADLYEKVNGINSYDIMLALATNSSLPKIKKRNGAYSIAASFALRTFENCILAQAPSRQELDALYNRYPDARVHIHVQTGQKLSSELQDGKSYLYAIINLGGKHKKDLLERLEHCKRMLPFKFKKI